MSGVYLYRRSLASDLKTDQQLAQMLAINLFYSSVVTLGL